jgi:CRISPR/Cas system-associated exonuclease Cas4 (RecB family)
MTTVEERTTAHLLLEWDRRRPRSRQRELGWSELGGCRRRAGYKLAGVEPTNPGGSVQAVLGTSIHDAVQQVLNEIAATDDLIEHAVSFAGIPGHLDRYEADTCSLVDVKTTSSNWLEHIKLHGPDKQHKYQLGGYGAALIAEGRKVKRAVIDYIARDTGEVYRWSAKFDPQWTREALQWLDSIKGMDPEMLNRDYAPDSAFCEHCPFRQLCWDGAVANRNELSVLFVENPNQLEWAEKLVQAKEDKKDAEKREKEARGALDAIRPNDEGAALVDVGLPNAVLKWTVSTPMLLDGDQVRVEYAKTGAKPPMKPGKEKVELRLVAKPKAPR